MTNEELSKHISILTEQVKEQNKAMVEQAKLLSKLAQINLAHESHLQGSGASLLYAFRMFSASIDEGLRNNFLSALAEEINSTENKEGHNNFYVERLKGFLEILKKPSA